MVARTGTQEVFVILDSRLTQLADAVGNRNGSGDSGRILVNIEGTVKVRDACPLVGDKAVSNKVRSVVIFIDLTMDFAQNIRQQRLTCFHHLVGLIFKISKHRLTVEGGADVVEVLGKQNCFFFLGLRVVEQIMIQQHLVGGGSNLCTEEGVVGIDERLGVVGVVAVHRVSGFMQQGEDVVQCTVVVEQHIRMHVINSGRVSAADLALFWIYVAPAFLMGAFDQSSVVFTQDSGCLEHQLICFIKAVLFGAVRHDWEEQVVHIALVQAQHPIAQRDIPLERLGVGTNGRQQVVIDLLRDKVFRQRLISCAAISSAFCDIDVGLDQRIVVGGEGVDIAAVGA